MNEEKFIFQFILNFTKIKKNSVSVIFYKYLHIFTN